VAFSSLVGGVSLSCACTRRHKYVHLSAVVHQGQDVLYIVACITKSTLHTAGEFLDHSIPSGCSLCKVSSKIAMIVPWIFRL
jgi:hypothetical protein